MILKDTKNRINSTCLIIFIFIAALLSDCSGCSKSGMIKTNYENRSFQTDSVNDKPKQTEEPFAAPDSTDNE
jgi:hypothetical protein